MRISDLSRQSGVPVATIKFYLREGLLPPGNLTARNQAEYDETHLSRLRFTRILTNVGQLSLSSVRDVLAAVDDRDLSAQELCQVVNRALFAEHPTAVAASAGERVGVDTARARVDGFLDQLGWQVDPDAPGRVALAQALVGLQRLGWDGDVDMFVPYAGAARSLAIHERDSMPAGSAETVVARTVLLEVALVALGRIAREHYLAG